MQNQINRQKLTLLNTDKQKSRAFQKFAKSIKRDTTRRAYYYALDSFMVLSKISSYDKMIKKSAAKVQELLEDYIISLNEYKFSSANQRLAGVELFFDMNMVLYHKKVLRKLLPNNDHEPGGKVPYTTDEINRMLSVTTKLRSKALIHFFASTGCRPAGIQDPVLQSFF